MKTKRMLNGWTLFFICLAWTATWSGNGGEAADGALLLAAGAEEDSFVRVAVRFAKIRIAPDPDARIVREIGYGSMLRVLGRSGDYFQVALLDAAVDPRRTPWYILAGEVEAAPETATQALVENRRLTFAPAEPVAGQPVLFTARRFRTPNLLRWDMGDGTVLTSGGKAPPGADTTLAYAFAAAGEYLVKVFDDGGSAAAPPVTVRVTVVRRPRTLRITPEQPKANHPLAVIASDFQAPAQIAWDMGDGTEIAPGPGPGMIKPSFEVRHVYKREGIFVVKAYDGGDKDQPPVALEIQVAADPRRVRMNPPRAEARKALEFSAVHFNTPGRLRWDMGDGTLIPPAEDGHAAAASAVTHRYALPGDYQVRVYDWDGDMQSEP
ncbi:MAG: hypothetical protein JXO51_03975, partial [Candidatus Aminicenantes bacterium]|nr:hypothetical protein [Candidatus Aminicenantes bacterium]